MINSYMTPVTLITAGDLAPTPSNYPFFFSGEIDAVVDRRLLETLSASDYRVFNLEVPLTDLDTPIPKDGPALKAPVRSIRGVKMLNPSVFTLSNNHIMDQGEQGLISTIELLTGNSIGFIGAGMNLKEASRPVILERGGIKIGIYACAEHEFSIAGEKSAGANPLDLLTSFDHISDLKSHCDFAVVLHHGGKEYYRYPSPELQKVCRKMIKCGADLVVCQHSHCVGSYEKCGEGIIVYGQGNFLFDRNNNEYWNTGLLVKAVFGEKMEVEFIPLSKNGNGVRLSDPASGEAILSDFYSRSENITSEDFVERKFEEYCLEYGQYYLATLAGLGKTVRRADKLLNRPLTRLIYSRRKLDVLRNHFECETHRELIIKYIQLLTSEKK